MNKYAAEKIASQYYEAGIQLALQGAGLTKTAKISKAKKGIAALLGAGGAAGAAKALMGKAAPTRTLADSPLLSTLEREQGMFGQDPNIWKALNDWKQYWGSSDRFIPEQLIVRDAPAVSDAAGEAISKAVAGGAAGTPSAYSGLNIKGIVERALQEAPHSGPPLATYTHTSPTAALEATLGAISGKAVKPFPTEIPALLNPSSAAGANPVAGLEQQLQKYVQGSQPLTEGSNIIGLEKLLSGVPAHLSQL